MEYFSQKFTKFAEPIGAFVCNRWPKSVFHLTDVIGRNRQKESNSSQKVLRISTPCFVYSKASRMSKVYTSQCERCFYLPPL